MAEGSLYRDRNLQIIYGVTLMSLLGVSAITPAFPSIVRELDITADQVGLLITFFSLPGVILSPVMGMLADRYGRKRILVPSLFLFAVAGTACTFVRDFNILLALRFLQGVGGASVGSVNVAIIGDLYSGRRRTEAIGLNSSVLSFSAAVYPVIGGALALLGWYYPFALAIFAVPVGLLVLTVLKSPEPRSHQSFREYLGGTWKHLKNIRILSLFAANTLAFVILYGAYLTYFTLLMGNSFGASSFVIGLIVSCMSITSAIVASQLGRISSRFSLGTIIKLAFIAYALALFLIPSMSHLWLLLIPAIILGIGQGANFPSIMASVAEFAPLEYRAVFLSLVYTTVRLGQTIGPLLMGLVYIYRDLNTVFYVAAALALVVPVVATVLGGKVKPQGGDTRQSTS